MNLDAPDADLDGLLARDDDPAAIATVVGTLAPGDRRRLLARADAVYARGGPDAERARRWYIALAADLDPSEPDDERRVARILAGYEIPRTLEPLLRRAASTEVDDEVAVRAMLVLAMIADARGGWDEAESWRRQAEDRGRSGADGADTSAKCARAARCAATGRETEALVLARALLRRGEPRTDVSVARQAELVALWSLRDVAACERVLRALEATVDAFPPPRRDVERAFTLERRAELAADRGETDAALGYVDAAARCRAGVPGPAYRAYHAVLRGRILLEAGRRSEVAATVAEAAAAPPDGDLFAFEARVLAACAGWDPATPSTDAAVEAVVADLEADRYPHVGNAIRRILALRLARALGAAPRGEPLALRAWAVASTAVLRRIAEIDHFVRRHPDDAVPTAEDLATFDAARRRLLAEHARLLPQMTPVIGPGLESLPAALRGAPDHRVAVCAWCGRLRTPDDVWLPIQHLVPLPLDLAAPVTHGICAACRDRFVAAADIAGFRAEGR